MFSSNKPKKAVDTLITKNTTIHGNVEFSGVLYIDGTVKGNVLSSEPGSMLTIGARGIVEGEVRVPHVSIFGEVLGDIYANEEVELMEKAKISGDVYYHLLQMAMGASVNGKLVHRSAEQTQRLEHKPLDKQKTTGEE
jgi:cytoskeletal protein CcmA (bactofilin family)